MTELTKNDLKNIKEIVIEVIEPFAKATQQDFNRMDKRLDGVDKRLDGVDKRLDGVDKRLDGVDKRLESIEVRLFNVEEELRQVRSDIRYIFGKLEEIEQKLNGLFKTTREDIDAMAGDVLDLRRRVEFLENKLKEIQTTRSKD